MVYVRVYACYVDFVIVGLCVAEVRSCHLLIKREALKCPHTGIGNELGRAMCVTCYEYIHSYLSHHSELELSDTRNKADAKTTPDHHIESFSSFLFIIISFCSS